MKLVVTKIRADTDLPVDNMVETLKVLEDDYENMCNHLPEWAYTTYEKYALEQDKRRLRGRIDAIKKKLRNTAVE